MNEALKSYKIPFLPVMSQKRHRNDTKGHSDRKLNKRHFYTSYIPWTECKKRENQLLCL